MALYNHRFRGIIVLYFLVCCIPGRGKDAINLRPVTVYGTPKEYCI